MRILISTTSNQSTVLIKGQGQFLRNKGHEVIYSTNDGIKAQNFIHEENLIFAPVPFSREINFFNDIYCLILACKILVKYKPNIVNAGTPKAGFIYMLAAKIVGIKIRIFTLRGLRSDTLKGVKRQLVRLFEKISCSCATNIIAISPSLKEEAIRLKLSYPDKINVFLKGSSNGVDLTRFHISDDIIARAKEKKKEWNISDGTFIFGYIGRIVKDKGIEELVAAFEKLQQIYNTKMLLIGSFDEEGAISIFCMEKIKQNKNIIVIDYTSDVPLYCYLLDVLILPSYREGFGNVVIEAAAMGVPAIVSDISGAKDTIENNETGLLIEPKNADSLLVSMKYYAENRELARLHGQNAKKRVENYFANEMIWNEQEKLYKKLLNM